MSDRHYKLFALFVTLSALLLVHVQPSTAMDDVKVHTSGSSSANVLIYKIAQEKGFYKEENLNVLTIAATSSAGIQGLVGGSFDFSQILGQTSAAILHGAPLKNVMVFDTRPLFWFFGGKRVRRLEDLKGGKLVGVSSLGANTDQMTREVLAMNGIDPRKDVVIQGTGTGAVRLAALLGGSLDAAITNPTESIVARKQGLNELFFYGDYDLNIVSGGAALTDRMLKEKPAVVRRFLRATLRALLWFRSNEKESVARMAEGFKISRDDALGIYKATLKSYTVDGTISRGQQEKIISFQRKQLKVEKEIAPEQVYDFTMLRTLNDELKKAGQR
ncbi:MAG TPA: ABC transporter substrate-binding protein [Candidatus Binatia bacterium]|nr:ABC transporter substrate-binding protein [Candidatus Binatia bacterium]